MNILVFNIARMGDLIESIPAMITLRHTHPDAHITLAVLPEYAWPAGLIPGIDAICYFDTRKPLQPFCEPSYDAIYNFSYSTLAAQVLSRIAAPQRIGMLLTAAGRPQFSDPATAYLWNFINTPGAPIFNFSDLLRHSVAAGPMEPAFYLKEGAANPALGSGILAQHGIDQRRPLVCMQTTAADPYRAVHEDVFAEAGRFLSGHCQVAVLAAPAERTRAERIAKRAGAIPLVCDLDGLLGVLCHTALLVTCNTGPMHLAAATGVRCLVLSCGTSQPAFDGPYGHGHVILSAARECHPCRQGMRCNDPVCTRDFDPATVAAAALSMVQGGPLPDPARMFATHCGQCGCWLNGHYHAARRFLLSVIGAMPIVACGEEERGAVPEEISQFARLVADGTSMLRQAIAAMQQGPQRQTLVDIAAAIKSIDEHVARISFKDKQWQSVVGFYKALVENCVAERPWEMLRELYAVFTLYNARLQELIGD
ncbi:MAG: hypothetical protein A2268_01505 [Candidatus Raymondbacteria bacterium RifOxyA12_full_50_37]|uniref:Heptosyltransferase n=1 Tax=Candidatus Raymondbacteria bacterium RIFOXYD12_FULL_49_13 TaxID=1817890 RepID=A0A1F7F985_UNCRA|nr:MAG: hypothetical protein A2268_01505 [Candidatus Raymondbacteria bacterium RifOxyA12_full_50_37]OGJ87902.1 MAG: hypothetical protein A2248_01790 [Candidatus Raymondbacteria bacterium RIFOXYA2_FULL_49_16]OGJ89190.1 MAG: hypothetical protein A2350_01810 [Candidatus Raymondbacteria bacterium RifOxyB12_full_50_8]OGJ93584.1 MAG: hypothetical protein A2487_07235 [Candidatus Raymondbacteria bacterium RifOxyC12_full_50_8]OGK03234.1 MAG: hypothetical protein A2519_13265 [Candidatus Raymondbacteria b